MKPFFIYKTIPQAQLEELFTYEPKLRAFISLNQPFTVRIMPDIYQCFVHTVISQQLSSAAIDSIWNKLVFSFKTINAKTLSYATGEQLNAIGLSTTKISLIKKISYDLVDKKLNFDKMIKWPSEDIYRKLMLYKYFNKWTIDMILLFGIGRPDILLIEDADAQRGLKRLYDLENVTDTLINKVKTNIPKSLWTIFTLCLWYIANISK